MAKKIQLQNAVYTLTILVCLFILSDSARRVSDEERTRKANLIQQLLKKFQKRDGHVRLVGGSAQFEGNVEILHNGKWGAVCDDEFGDEEASVVCAQLGFGAPVGYTHSGRFGLATRKFWMDNLYCDGTESGLNLCRFDGWGTSDCTPEEAAGVTCKDPKPEAAAEKEDFRVDLPRRVKTHIKEANGGFIEYRINGGRSREEGRVEVKFRGVWGSVCGDGWSLLEAMVICKSLRLGYAMSAVQTSLFGGNTSSIILSGTECTGSEDSLSHCLHDEIGEVTCPGDRKNLAGVICIREMADLVFDHNELMRTAHLEDRQLFALQCAMEENCLASQAYVVQKEQIDWFTETRRLLKFTASVLNIGTADFRPSIPKHLWEWHMCHMHYHSMEVFATFDIMDEQGRRVAEGHKASFCLEDNTCLPGVEPKYACEHYGDQGISVNCSDVYKYNIDCQWVDISELAPGQYSMKVAVNPELKVPEMSIDNNAALCKLLYTETYARVYDCILQRP